MVVANELQTRREKVFLYFPGVEAPEVVEQKPDVDIEEAVVRVIK